MYKNSTKVTVVQAIVIFCANFFENIFRCMPYCPGGCPNGICSAPHLCICNVGYYKDTSVKGRSSCVKRSRRSIEKPTNIADLLIFDVPDDY